MQERQQDLGACYVLPPVGCFQGHASGTAATERPSPWQEAWGQEGTRTQRPEQKHRALCQLTTRGPPTYLVGEVRLPEEALALLWRTRLDLASEAQAQERLAELSRR